MKRALLCGVCALLSMSGALAQPLGKSEPVPPELVPDVERSERMGRALFDAHERVTAATPLMEKARAVAESAAIEKCGEPYRTIVVLPPDGSQGTPILVYRIGNPPPSLGMVIGRHFRIEVSGDGEKVLSVASSTKGCMLIPSGSPSGGRIAAAVMGHVLSPAPSEFHVFLSLKHGVPLYVQTRAGHWYVDAGKITFSRDPMR